MDWKKIFANATLGWGVALCCLIFAGYIGWNSWKSPNVPVPPRPNNEPYLIGIPSEGFALGSLAKIKVALPEILPLHFKSASVTWKLLEVKSDNGILRLIEKVDVDILDDGTLYFGAGIEKRELVCQAMVSFLFVDEANIASVKNYFLFQRVKIGAGPLPPPPNPDPLPPVDPTFEEGRFGLAKFSYEVVKSTIKEKKKEGAKAIADSLQGIGSAIAAGAIKTPELALTKAFESNNAALTAAGINPILWDDFFNRIQDRLFQLYQEKKINVIDDYRVAFVEITLGLSAVK